MNGKFSNFAKKYPRPRRRWAGEVSYKNTLYKSTVIIKDWSVKTLAEGVSVDCVTTAGENLTCA